MTRHSLAVFVLMMTVHSCSWAGVPLDNNLPTRTVKTNSTEDIFIILDSLGYTAEAWQQGVREIPRIYMTNIPSRWKTESGQVTVAKKKEIFFRLLAPVILRANELILLEQDELKRLIAHNPEPGSKESDALLDLARKYKVIKKKRNPGHCRSIAGTENKSGYHSPQPGPGSRC